MAQLKRRLLHIDLITISVLRRLLDLHDFVRVAAALTLASEAGRVRAVAGTSLAVACQLARGRRRITPTAASLSIGRLRNV